jgi:hypothetical protein
MATPVPPERELELNDWARTFHARLAATAGGFDVPPDQIAALGLAADAYAVALRAASDPMTRTAGQVARKRAAKAVLLDVARRALHVVAACGTLTETDRADLGMRPARNRRPPRSAVPTGRPIVRVDERGRVRLCDAEHPVGPLARRKPDGVSGAFLFVMITPADAPVPPNPDHPAGPRFAAMTTSTSHRLTIPRGHFGDVLHVYAQWCNRRGVPGPFGPPASVLLTA